MWKQPKTTIAMASARTTSGGLSTKAAFINKWQDK